MENGKINFFCSVRKATEAIRLIAMIINANPQYKYIHQTVFIEITLIFKSDVKLNSSL